MNLRHRRRTFVLSGLAGATMSGLIGASTVRLVGFVRQLVTARAFGLGAELDAFLLAALIPTLVGSVAGSAINTALVPRLTRYASQKAEVRHSERFWLSVWSAILLGVGIGAVVWILANPISSIVAASNEAYRPTIATTVRVLAIVPMLVISYEVIAAGLISKGHFASAALLPIFTPLAIAIGVISGVRTSTGLAIATVVGSAAVVLAGILVSAHQFGGISWRPGLQISSFRSFANDSIALIAAMILAQATSYIDKVMAASLGTGSVSALEFGSRVPDAVIGVAALGVANAVAQRSGDLASRGQFDQIALVARSVGRWIGGAGTLLAVVLILASPWLIDTIYLGDNFTEENARIVLGVQIAYLCQIPLYLLAIVASRVLASVQRMKLITMATLLHLVLSVSGNMLLMGPFGISGIAAATSLAYAITGALLWFLMSRSIKRAA